MLNKNCNNSRGKCLKLKGNRSAYGNGLRLHTLLQNRSLPNVLSLSFTERKQKAPFGGRREDI